MSIPNNTTSVNPREQCGLEIANTNKLHMRGRVWPVPSQTTGDKGDKYTVANVAIA